MIRLLTDDLDCQLVSKRYLLVASIFCIERSGLVASTLVGLARCVATKVVSRIIGNRLLTPVLQQLLLDGLLKRISVLSQDKL